MHWSMDNKRVNPPTFWVSMILRGLLVLAGIALVAAGTVWTFGQVFSVVVGLGLIYGSKTVVVTFADKR